MKSNNFFAIILTGTIFLSVNFVNVASGQNNSIMKDTNMKMKHDPNDQK